MTDSLCFEFTDTLPSPAAYPGAQVARVTGRLWGKDELLTALAEQLAFPSYFGMNWDALEECLSILLPNQGRRVVIVHEALPKGMADSEIGMYLRVLYDVCQSRLRSGDPQLTAVFLSTDRSRVLGIHREGSSSE